MKKNKNYSEATDFFKSWTSFVFGLIFLIICSGSLLNNALAKQDFNILNLFNSLSAFLPFFIPALLAVVWTSSNNNDKDTRNENSDTKRHKRTNKFNVLKNFKAAFLFMLALFGFTLPFAIAELIINSALTTGVVISSYIVILINVAAYIALCILAAVITKNIALKTILSFVFALIFTISTQGLCSPFFIGFFEGYNALLLFMAFIVFLGLALIISAQGFNFVQKIMQLICLSVIVISLHLICKPFANNMFIDMAPVTTFTASQETAPLIQDITNPVKIELFVPKFLLKEQPQMASYAKLTANYAKTLAKMSNGKITFSDYTGQYSSGEFALVISGQGKEVYINLPGTYKQGEAETAIIGAILDKGGIKRKVIGLASSLPLDEYTNEKGEVIVPRWFVTNLIRQNYDIISVPFSSNFISDKIDVLMIVNPKSSDSKEAEYFTSAFTSFMRKKGKALIFADPVPEAEAAYPLATIKGDSFANDLLSPFGLKITNDIALRKADAAIKVNINDKDVPYLARFSIDKAGFNTTEGMMSEIEKINFTSPAVIGFTDKLPTITYSPLITAEPLGADISLFKNFTDPSVLLDKQKELSEPAVLALKATGTFSADRHIDLILFADSDILYNQFWLNGRGAPVASNGDLVLSALDSLSGRKIIPSYKDEREINLLSPQASLKVLIAATVLSGLLFIGIWLIASLNRKRKKLI